MKLLPWLEFFRLPNLPTAPGDALAGAAVLLAFAGGSPRRALVAGVAALGLYMYGLADNDVVGAPADASGAPERPIPRGAISLRSAKVARSLCLFGALLAGALFNLPPGWWLVAALLTGAICLYNRWKNLWMMGVCRGLSVLAGGAAVLPPKMPTASAEEASALISGLVVLCGVALGWTLYVAAVTKLSEGEERESEGLGNRRYLLGFVAFAPLLALSGAFLLPAAPRDFRLLALPALGCAWTFATWCAAVAPLWRAHGSSARRAAVGRTIGALLYLQIGFMLMVPCRALVACAAALWFVARLVRRCAPSISGS